MTAILEIIISHPSQLLALWVLFSVGGVVAMRRTFWSMFDPIPLYIVLAIAPGISGIAVVALNYPQYDGYIYKAVLLTLSLAAFFYCFCRPFKAGLPHPRDLVIEEGRKWQACVLIVSASVIVLNVYINGNVESNDPALRFRNVTMPGINYLSISLSSYPAVFFAFTRDRKVRIGAGILLLISIGVQLGAGTGKAIFLSLLMTYCYWGFSRGSFNTSATIHRFSRLKISISDMRFAVTSIILALCGLVYLLSAGLSDLSSLLIRFVLTLDSPLIFLTSSAVHPHAPYSATGFYGFLDVWLKPVIKNIGGITYKFENISQYLTFVMTGYRATGYDDTSWQPNNNIIVDLLVLHGWVGVPLSAAAGYIVGKVHCALKSRRELSRWSLPLFVTIVIFPFYAFADVQSFFTSTILSYAFVGSVNMIFILCRNTAPVKAVGGLVMLMNRPSRR